MYTVTIYFISDMISPSWVKTVDQL